MNENNPRPAYYSAPIGQTSANSAPAYQTATNSAPVYQAAPGVNPSPTMTQAPAMTASAPSTSTSLSGLDEFDNMLVAQIDAFREKALTLQAMINEKEATARNLSNSVFRLQSENQRLAAELEKRKAEASGLASDVQRQVDSAFAKIDARLAAFEGNVGQKIDSSSDRTTAGVKASIGEMNGSAGEIRSAVAEMKQAVGGIGDTVREACDKLNSTVGEKLDASGAALTENVGAKFTELDTKIGAKLDDKLGDGLGSISSTVTQAVGVLGGSLDTVVKQISDNAHSENVLLYRNIQDVIREHDTSEEDDVKMNKSFGGLKKSLTITNVLLGVNLVILIIVLLRAFGIL